MCVGCVGVFGGVWGCVCVCVGESFESHIQYLVGMESRKVDFLGDLPPSLALGVLRMSG